MRAYITTPETDRRAINRDRALTHTVNVVAYIQGALAVIVTAKFYRSRSGDGASPVYCNVWTHYSAYASGRGTAKGHGYHKASAALSEALSNAGVRLLDDDGETVCDIAACGDSAMDEALLALAAALVGDVPMTVVRN